MITKSNAIKRKKIFMSLNQHYTQQTQKITMWQCYNIDEFIQKKSIEICNVKVITCIIILKKMTIPLFLIVRDKEFADCCESNPRSIAMT